MTYTICIDSAIRPVRIWLVAAVATAIVLLATGELRAQGFFYVWDNPAGGSYNSNGNWLPVGIPNDLTEGAGFFLDETYTVGFPTNVTTSVAEIGNGTVMFDLDTSGTPRTYTVQALTVNKIGGFSPWLHVDDGTVNATLHTTLGDDVGASGILVIRSEGTVTTPTAIIGDAGNGLVMILNFHQTVRQDGIFNTGNATLGKAATANGSAEVYGVWNSGPLTVGDAGDGFLQILGATTITTGTFTHSGIVNSTTASIAAQSGSSGSVTVHGMQFEGTSDTARWNVTNNLNVGGTDFDPGGTGSLTIDELGRVDVGGFTHVHPDGTITVRAGGTFNADLMGISGGSVMIESGGAFNLAPDAGVNPIHGGNFTVEDLYVLENDCFFKVGDGGTMNFPGGLNIENGGIMIDDPGSKITTGVATWGDNQADAAVFILDQAMVETGDLRLANSDMADTDALVSVATGADLVTNGILRLAPAGGASTSAELRVDGAGSTFTQNDSSMFSIRVGNAISGSAVINVRNGGRFTTGTGETTIREQGVINLESNGVFDARGPVRVDGQFNFLGGKLHIGQYIGNLENQGGTLAPGHSAGFANITGNYTQHDDGSLEIEIGGTIPTFTHDLVNVTGAALLNGELQLALINGFVPGSGNQFVVFDAGSLTNSFSNASNGQRLTTTDGIGSFLVHYGPASLFDPTQIVLTDFLLGGDFNGNGVVDAADYVVWREGLGTAYVANDYNTWKANFGRTIGTGHSSVSTETAIPVPEPAGLVLFAFAALPLSLGFRPFLRLPVKATWA